jgi:hypothetical protein
VRLQLDVPERSRLDEPLVVVARLENDGASPVVTSSRLNILEGDLSVALRPPGGAPGTVVWPWPMDSARREATLAPGERIEGGVLLHWGVAGPVCSSAGRYEVGGEFTTAPAEPPVASRPATVLRDDAGSGSALACQRLLLDADVSRSLASASVVGSAGPALAELASADAPAATRFLATLALGDAAAVAALAATVEPVDAAAWTTAVLPAGLFATDPRVAAVAEAVGTDARAAAMLAERPI